MEYYNANRGRVLRARDRRKGIYEAWCLAGRSGGNAACGRAKIFQDKRRQIHGDWLKGKIPHRRI